MVEPPTVETERLVLRAFQEADAEDVRRLANDDEIARNTLKVPHPYSHEDAVRWIAAHRAAFRMGDRVDFAVVQREDHALAGAIGLEVDKEQGRAELGYWIGRPYWGRGYCTEACLALIQYGFEYLGLHRVHASHFTRNPASGRVLRKLGMHHEGTLRQHIRKAGAWEDLDVYGMLRPDYEALVARNRTRVA